MRFMSVTTTIPDRRTDTSPPHAVLNDATPAGTLRPVHLSTDDLLRLAQEATSAAVRLQKNGSL